MASKFGLMAMVAVLGALVATTVLLVTQTPYSLYFLLLGAALIGMLCTSILALSIARKKIIQVGQAAYVAPDEWLAHFERFSKALQATEEITLKAYRGIGASTEETLKSVSDNTETLRKLRGKIDEQDAEILRLRAGYDSVILKRALKPFSALLDSLRDHSAPIEKATIVEVLEEAFEAAGVSIYWPAVGKDIREIEVRGTISDRHEVEESTEEDDDYRIVRVNHPGLIIETGEWPQVLSPAKVTIYRAR